MSDEIETNTKNKQLFVYKNKEGEELTFTLFIFY